ncbi:unnamed protein product [Didymodactylos carnosus]|uniref:Uncharacterized protein n=1 Tax=Didymodactylos carnosus TaxID=1234261 RepID=A0A815G202_9BILA|nr:unnamed protein product [Didymodactylos carnosus]CAF1333201.1 unnamed protein product [Didymodactylos carnosus]CAF3815123.1 unnamed protein product [Didymodactylos carnosus]CAF4188830.1 unnamed protein product [Didymodactylos carnosus]
MISDFLVQHPSGPFCELSEDEWKQAVAKYTSLSDDDDVNYLRRTATISINIGTDVGYRRSGFEQFLKGFDHSLVPVPLPLAPSTTGPALSVPAVAPKIHHTSKEKPRDYSQNPKANHPNSGKPRRDSFLHWLQRHS